MNIAGFYFDQKHGGCLRRIIRKGHATFKIHGVFGDDEYPTHGYWFAMINIDAKKNDEEYYLSIDFSGKPGKKRIKYKAIWNSRKRTIEWYDGNIWQKLFVHNKQLLDLKVDYKY